MRPQTYFRLTFFIPLILWVISLVISLALSGKDLSPLENIFYMPIFYYSIGIILWFIPYVILMIGMLIWTKNRSVSALRNAGLAAPIIFYILMLAEAGLVYILSGTVGNLGRDFPGMVLMLGVLSLIFGYLCVGIAFGLSKILQARNIIQQEEPVEN
jgi:hypothetical protein